MSPKMYLAVIFIAYLSYSVEINIQSTNLQANPNCTVSFCTTCNITTICDTCDPTYYLQNNICSLCNSAIAYCADCFYNSVNRRVECNTCANGYFLVNNLQCAACSGYSFGCQTCAIINSNVTCTSCLDGFYLNINNQCVPCNTNIVSCTLCTGSDVVPFQICTQCATNFILINGSQCQSCSTYINQCQTCNTSNNTCDTCIIGDYRKASGAMCVRCTDTITSCSTCVAIDDIGSSITCLTCGNSTFLKDNTCLACPQFIPSCVICTTINNTCNVCSDGHYRKDSGSNCALCSDSIMNCILCNANNDLGTSITCTKCATNYYLYVNTCVVCSKYITNCVSCNNGNNTCDICNSGFYRQNSGRTCSPCQKLVANCSDCSALNDAGTIITCNSCALNTFAVNNTCVGCSQFILNCSTCYTGNNTCDTCSVGYYRANRGKNCIICSNAIPSCGGCTANDDLGTNVTCSQCLTGTYLSVDKLCVTCDQLVLNCISCNALNNTCDNCSSGNYRKDLGASCATCNSLIPSCTLCLADNDLGTSATCNACTLGTFLVANACVGCAEFIKDCKTCNLVNNTCDACAEGTYRKDSGKICKLCSDTITFCTTCAATNDTGATIVCSQCLLGTFLVNNVCLICSQFISSCDTCNTVNNTCDTCSTGFYRKANGTVCSPCSDLVSCAVCQADNDAGSSITCQQCAVDYYLSNNTCLTCSQYILLCVTCNSQNNTCDNCLDGTYRKNSGKQCGPCSDLVSNCTLCTANDDAGTSIVCSKCAFGLFPGNNVCLTCSQLISSCATCNTGNNTCDVCSDGFYRKNGGVSCAPCTDLISRCSVCSANNDIGSSINCSSCSSGTYLVSNTCLTCPQFIISCVSCNSFNNTCDICSGGNYRKNNGTSCGNCSDLVSNCILCSSVDDAGSSITCDQCRDNTFLYKNTCVTCQQKVPNCVTCSLNQTCEVCADGFYASLDGLTCISCSNISNCNSCKNDGFNGAVCYGCILPYIVNKNECVTCISVIPDCSCCIQNTLDLSITCDGCKNGKILSGDSLSCVVPDTSSGSNTGVIVSSVIGGSILLIGGGYAIYYCLKRRKSGLPVQDNYQKI